MPSWSSPAALVACCLLSSAHGYRQNVASQLDASSGERLPISRLVGGPAVGPAMLPLVLPPTPPSIGFAAPFARRSTAPKSRLWGIETQPSFDWHNEEFERESAVVDDGDVMPISLPKDWARKLKGGSIRKVHSSYNSYVFTAGLEEDPEYRVAFKVLRTADMETYRELRTMPQLQYSGHTVKYLGSQVFPETTYIMMEVADGNLAQLLQEVPQPEAGRCAMPLNESLPLLIDLLRGIKDLDSSGIVHGDLTENNVLLKDGRAIISDFGLSVQILEPDLELGRSSLNGKIMPSLLRHAPETIEGYPTGASNNVWAVGMIFAKMTLGYLPTQKLIERLEPEALEDWRPDGRMRIRTLIGWLFSVRDDAGFQKLSEEDPENQPVREILMGLLDVAPDRRWSSTGALEMAMRVARERGIEVKPRRAPPSAPGGWDGDWQ
mmetsp:Transcript_95564/g.275964  ORF Transcript_95564/g.275964 Transcript_95564/m.275964 type:complete len:436 (-) Transcript_95564:335-1642(-)